MIKADFFPTVTTNPATGSEFTDTLSQIAVTEKFPGAYYLGWIAPENVPQSLTPGRLTTTPNGDGTSTLHFTNDMPKNTNFACGYLGLYVGIGTARLPIAQLEYTDGAWIAPGKTGGDWQYAFFNKCNVTTTGKYNFEFGVVWGAGATFDDVTSWIGASFSTADGGDTFAKNLLEVTDDLARIWLGYGHYINLGRQAFTRDDGGFELDAEDGTHIIGYITGFGAIDNRNYIRNTDNPAFFVDMPGHDAPCVMTGTRHYDDNAGFTLDGLVSGAFDGSYLGLVGIQGDFDVSTADLAALSTLNTQIYLVPNRGYFVRTAYSPFRISFIKIYNISEIVKMLSLQLRLSFTGDDGYVSGSIYAPYITEDNEFTATIITGNLADTTFKSKLRPWQYDAEEWQENDFTENDIPEMPEEDEPQNVGASILRPSTLGVGGTSGFITQYVLTAAEIATLGRTLWTSFVNPDYWKNFLFSLAIDTGSFDMSSLLDYFVSLRVYPFSLINVPSYAATGSPSIYIGSGMVPLTITASTTLHTINNFADYIDAGSCTVHSAYFHDDFRDFSNVEIMLYLPYCGTVQLNPGDVVGGTLHAQYAIDFATGGCVAYVDLTSPEGISYPIAVLPGSIGADVPLTATNAGQIAARFAGDVINFASTVTSNAASDLNARASAATGAFTGGASGALSRASSGIGTIATGGINAGIQHATQALDMATRPAIGIPTLSGGRGFSSFGAPQTAYIQIRRGIYKRPQTYDHTVGSPSSASKTIGSLAGLVKGAVDTAGLSCTADEAAEVRTLIAAGIIV